MRFKTNDIYFRDTDLNCEIQNQAVDIADLPKIITVDVDINKLTSFLILETQDGISYKYHPDETD